MSALPRTSIEQWAVLKAVVEEGGFAQAAAALNRSQSSVSYAIAQLQRTLGVALLEPSGRRAVLTELGRALLADAKPLIEDLSLLERRAKVLSGKKVRVRLLVDSAFPKPRLFQALQALAQQQPHVEVSLRETVRQSVTDLGDDFDVAVLVANFAGSQGVPIIVVELIAVAAAGHPLAQADAVLHRTTLARYPRAEIRSVGAGESDETEAPGKIWRMSTVEAGIGAVRQGLCYGWLPKSLIADDIARGTLIALPLEVGRSRHIPLGLYYSASGRSDPAARLLGELLLGQGEAALQP